MRTWGPPPSCGRCQASRPQLVPDIAVLVMATRRQTHPSSPLQRRSLQTFVHFSLFCGFSVPFLEYRRRALRIVPGPRALAENWNPTHFPCKKRGPDSSSHPLLQRLAPTVCPVLASTSLPCVGPLQLVLAGWEALAPRWIAGQPRPPRHYCSWLLLELEVVKVGTWPPGQPHQAGGSGCLPLWV